MKTGETTGFTKARKGWLDQALQETSGDYPIYISCGAEEQLSSSRVNYFIQEVTGTIASSPLHDTLISPSFPEVRGTADQTYRTCVTRRR